MTACQLFCSNCRMRRSEYIVDGDGKQKGSSLKAELTISNQYSKSNSKQPLYQAEECENFCSMEITFAGLPRAVFTNSNSSKCIFKCDFFEFLIYCGVYWSSYPSHTPDPQFREHKLTPVMSEQMRELSGKMLIPSNRIRLLDTVGHGKIATGTFIHLYLT